MVHRAAPDAQVLSPGPPDPTRIYHFTDAANLPAILDSGCVYCKSRLPSAAQSVDISHYDVQRRRQAKLVGCGPGGVLHDYVPFYFATRSPMMYVISRGGVEGCSSNTKRLVYLVSDLRRAQEVGSRFVFTDGHATKAFTTFYEDDADLDKVDWGVMRLRQWTDTPEDPDRSRRRQAEFLVHESFPWEAVDSLAVKDANMKRRLDWYLAEEWPDRIKPVRVEADWYFS